MGLYLKLSTNKIIKHTDLLQLGLGRLCEINQNITVSSKMSSNKLAMDNPHEQVQVALLSRIINNIVCIEVQIGQVPLVELILTFRNLLMTLFTT